MWFALHSEIAGQGGRFVGILRRGSFNLTMGGGGAGQPIPDGFKGGSWGGGEDAVRLDGGTKRFDLKLYLLPALSSC